MWKDLEAEIIRLEVLEVKESHAKGRSPKPNRFRSCESNLIVSCFGRLFPWCISIYRLSRGRNHGHTTYIAKPLHKSQIVNIVSGKAVVHTLGTSAEFFQGELSNSFKVFKVWFLYDFSCINFVVLVYENFNVCYVYYFRIHVQPVPIKPMWFRFMVWLDLIHVSNWISKHSSG